VSAYPDWLVALVPGAGAHAARLREAEAARAVAFSAVSKAGRALVDCSVVDGPGGSRLPRPHVTHSEFNVVRDEHILANRAADAAIRRVAAAEEALDRHMQAARTTERGALALQLSQLDNSFRAASSDLEMALGRRDRLTEFLGLPQWYWSDGIGTEAGGGVVSALRVLGHAAQLFPRATVDELDTDGPQ
jgi:hypothetical protein